MKLLLKYGLIFILIFLFLGPYVSFLAPWHAKLFLRLKIMRADFLAGVTLYKDSLLLYQEILGESPLIDTKLRKELQDKIKKTGLNIQNYNQYYQEETSK